jgi:hypothetical protein
MEIGFGHTDFEEFMSAMVADGLLVKRGHCYHTTRKAAP